MQTMKMRNMLSLCLAAGLAVSSTMSLAQGGPPPWGVRVIAAVLRGSVPAVPMVRMEARRGMALRRGT
ncbi:hypothetical protein A6P55_00065 [Pandoraea pnomenusa]|nr:hypothetical protein A6P55_00065 [Pandoraea pnomenusa]